MHGGRILSQPTEVLRDAGVEAEHCVHAMVAAAPRPLPPAAVSNVRGLCCVMFAWLVPSSFLCCLSFSLCAVLRFAVTCSGW